MSEFMQDLVERRSFGIMFHHFHDHNHPRGQGSICADELAELIERLNNHRSVQLLDAHAWLERALDDRLEAGDICLTFDDGLRCQIEVAAPVLEAYGLTGFWFIYTSVFTGGFDSIETYRYFRTVHYESIDDFYDEFDDVIEASAYAQQVAKGLSGFDPAEYKPYAAFFSDRDRIFRHVRDNILSGTAYRRLLDRMMQQKGCDPSELIEKLWISNSDIRSLVRDNNVIGLHSHTHPVRIDFLSREEQRNEYRKNFDELTQMTGSAPVCMAHPCNAYNAETLDVLNELGIRIGFSSWPLDIGQRMLEFPRADHGTLAEFMSQS